MHILFVQIFSGSRSFWSGIGCQLGKERRKNKIMSLRVGGTSKQNIIGLRKAAGSAFGGVTDIFSEHGNRGELLWEPQIQHAIRVR